jgi:hypothetical protein
LREWRRVIKPGGDLEVWVPDGVKIAKAFVDAELDASNSWQEDGWYYLNDAKDPCVWAAGRIYTYGDGKGTLGHPDWHRALFSARYLRHLLERAGFRDIKQMNRTEVRGHDHGWINLGMKGTK